MFIYYTGFDKKKKKSSSAGIKREKEKYKNRIIKK